MKYLESLGSFMASLLVPFLILMTVIRFLFSPALLQVEYNTPNFPPDPYGFSQADRLKYSKISLDWLYDDQTLADLAQVRLADGVTPLYTDRELSHMEDVKVLFQHMLIAHDDLLVVFAVILLITWRAKKFKSGLRAFSRGGWITLGLIAIILVFVVLSFNNLFTWFHELFFTGNSWLFLYTDSLIRLFPIQLWQDAFIWMGVFTSILALIFGVFGRMYGKEK
jgi:integral membrane protein (TIGR01906 family)